MGLWAVGLGAQGLGLGALGLGLFFGGEGYRGLRNQGYHVGVLFVASLIFGNPHTNLG